MSKDTTVQAVTYMPSPVFRSIVRWRLNKTLQKYARIYTPETDENFANHLKSYPEVAIDTDKANEQHYTCPTEYFEVALGPLKKYSACLWEGCNTLAEAEIKTLDYYCEWLELSSLPEGSAVLDVGCGWGSFTLFAAKKFPKLKFTCVSNSPTQREFILGHKLPNVSCHTINLGKKEGLKELSSKGPFQRAVSIEMFEHMKRYDLLLDAISAALTDTGKLLVQIFVHDQYPNEFDDNYGWMGQRFFSGGNMPSKNLLYQFQDHMRIIKTKFINGVDYQKTLEAWRELHEQHKAKIVDIFEKARPGEGYADWVAWWMFYVTCAECFGYDGGRGAGTEWFSQLYLFKNSRN
eukprot:m.119592 g.119592  ORF g.119592 m.119592 type:complete len:349 (-) comp14323_c0_seq5:356-1402(-)